MAKYGKKALQRLVKALKDDHPQVRLAAVLALASIGDPGAVEALVGALEDKWPPVKREAIKALRLLTDEDFGDDVEAWKTWFEKNFEKANKGKKKES